jgi:uncharacterized short protein YbdD (DUF466 family)
MLLQKNTRNVGDRAKRALRLVWYGIRAWCGDSAYESYLASKATRESRSARLTASEFYVERVNARYSRPNRCC